jgi:hypothetical protein
MQQTNNSIEKFNKIVLSQQEINQINKMGISLRKVKVAFGDLKDKSVAKLAPEMNRMLEQGFEFLLKNSDKIISALTSIASWINHFILAMGRAMNLIGEFVMKENAFKGIAIAIIGLASAFAPITSAVIALLLLLDDISVWKSGGDSLFGDFYEGIDKFISKMQDLTKGNIFKNLFEGSKDFGKDMWEALKNLNDEIGIFRTGIAMAVLAFGAFKALDFLRVISMLKMLASTLKMVASAMWVLARNPIALGIIAAAGLIDLGLNGKESVVGQSYEKIKDTTLSLVEKTKGVFGGETKDTPLILNSVVPPMNNYQNSSNVSTSRSSTNNITINVNSIEEAMKAKQEIDMQTEMETIFNSIPVLQ